MIKLNSISKSISVSFNSAQKHSKKVTNLDARIKSTSNRIKPLPKPVTFLRSKTIGRWLVDAAFGDQTERTFNSTRRDRMLQKYSHETVDFDTADGLTLKGTLVTPPMGLQRGKKTYVFCSGSFACYESYIKNFGRKKEGVLKKLIEEGHQVLLFDYRGFGENIALSQPSAKGIRRDGEAAYKCMRDRGIKNKDIVMYGYSVGGPLAAEVAAKHKTDLILDRTFLDTGSMIKDAFPPLLGIIPGKIAYRLFPLSNVKHLQNFKGHNLKIIIEQEGKKKDPRIKKFKATLKKIKRDTSDCLTVIKGMPHIFDNTEPPTKKFLKNIHFK